MTALSTTLIPHSEQDEHVLKDVQERLNHVVQHNQIKNKKPYHFSVLVCNDTHIQNLNKTYRHKDKPTNILSFPDGTEEDGVTHLGDLIISHETMQRESRDMGISSSDHWCHLIIHGILHLLGHDHEDEDEAEEMETLEIQWLAVLGIKNPYADT